MRAELRGADELREIRSAALGWRADGAIDEATLDAIHARYPDDRHRARLAFRLLFFLLTLLGGLAVCGFAIALLDIRLFSGGSEAPFVALLVVLAGLALIGATIALGPLRLRGFGVEEGLAALALGFGFAALGLGLDEAGVSTRTAVLVLGLGLAAAAATMAWRWGLPATGALAAGGLLVALGGLPETRLLWILAAVPLAIALRRLSRTASTAPAHRRRAAEAQVVALAALYLSLHPALAMARGFAWTRPATEALGSSISPPPLLGWTAIFVLPLLLLARGVRQRDRLELDLGAVGLLASAAALSQELALMPGWARLVLAGAALGAAALTLRTVFDRRTHRTLAGFTDRPLGEGVSTQWLELAATLAALAPSPRPAEPPPAFEGQGGDFGGGGASGKF